MLFSFPTNSLDIGFIPDGLGSHSSRTIMLSELRLLFSSCSEKATYEEYKKAVQEDNILLKQTEATRQKSFRYLRELYSLRSDTLLFRAFRDLWPNTMEAQPILAVLCSVARDPSLRGSTDVILNTPFGTEVTPHTLSLSAGKYLAGKVGHDTLAKIGRNVASSWTQSGHLKGRTNKVRVQAQAHPSSCAYALFLGFLCGERGEGLFHTPWAQILDAPVYTLHNLAKAASQYGWLEYRQSGSITDISFKYLLREKGESLV